MVRDFPAQLIIESPGRINIIGEHTDYNMGYVLPTAIDKKIVFKLRRNETPRQARVYTRDYDKEVLINLDQLQKSEVAWENYILGVLNEISLLTNGVQGFDCTLESNLPSGSGLSSSAALECGLAYGLNELFSLGLSKLDIVQLSQRAEHNYAGTLCGIMDQFASVMSKAGHVLLLDCRSLEYKMIPIQINPYKIIMLNTKVSHNLATSAYNTRKSECEEGVAAIKQSFPNIDSLRDVTEAMLAACEKKMSETVFKRCTFVVAENQRVLETTSALRANDLKKVGRLLYTAHEGISKLYEVSCPESDFLVEFAKRYPNVLGARQTGGGFGGCVLNIVHEDAVEGFIKSAHVAYQSTFDIELEAFEAAPATGTQVSFKSW